MLLRGWGATMGVGSSLVRLDRMTTQPYKFRQSVITACCNWSSHTRPQLAEVVFLLRALHVPVEWRPLWFSLTLSGLAPLEWSGPDECWFLRMLQ